MKRDIEEVGQTYGIENWSGGYFSINHQGNLTVKPTKGTTPGADVYELIQELVDKRKLSLPILLRFPQILGTQLNPFSAPHKCIIGNRLAPSP